MPEEGINNAGTLQVSSGSIRLGGNWTNTGTFIPGTGEVELIGTTGQAISGVNTFYNLTCTSAGNQLFFEAGNYADALGQLQNDILGKTDGCANAGKPDKNDWIITCAAQGTVYPYILVAIDAVEAIMQ